MGVMMSTSGWVQYSYSYSCYDAATTTTTQPIASRPIGSRTTRSYQSIFVGQLA